MDHPESKFRNPDSGSVLTYLLFSNQNRYIWWKISLWVRVIKASGERFFSHAIFFRHHETIKEWFAAMFYALAVAQAGLECCTHSSYIFTEFNGKAIFRFLSIWLGEYHMNLKEYWSDGIPKPNKIQFFKTILLSKNYRNIYSIVNIPQKLSNSCLQFEKNLKARSKIRLFLTSNNKPINEQCFLIKIASLVPAIHSDGGA